MYHQVLNKHAILIMEQLMKLMDLVLHVVEVEKTQEQETRKFGRLQWIWARMHGEVVWECLWVEGCCLLCCTFYLFRLLACLIILCC